MACTRRAITSFINLCPKSVSDAFVQYVACGLRLNGSIACWNSTFIPYTVSIGQATYISFARGNDFTCGITLTRDLYCCEFGSPPTPFPSFPPASLPESMQLLIVPHNATCCPNTGGNCVFNACGTNLQYAFIKFKQVSCGTSSW